MVNLVNRKPDGCSDWKGWMLGICILIIAGLATLFSGLTIGLVKDMRTEFLQEFQSNRVKDAEHDRCIAELKAHQNERLERERRMKQ